MTSFRMAIILLISLHASASALQSVPVRVSIAAPEATVRSGDAVRIDVTISNLTHHTVEISSVPDMAEAARHVDVYDSEGKLLPRRRVPNPLSMGTVQLGGGKSLRESFVLNDFADLSKPGTYRIQVKHEMWRVDMTKHDAYRSLIPSNILVITIVK